jgi:hypothetical protein
MPVEYPEMGKYSTIPSAQEIRSTANVCLGVHLAEKTQKPRRLTKTPKKTYQRIRALRLDIGAIHSSTCFLDMMNPNRPIRTATLRTIFE